MNNEGTIVPRERIEKYSVQFLGSWALGVAILLIASLVWGGNILFGILFHEGEITQLILPFVLLIFSGGLITGISEMEDSWKSQYDKYFDIPEEDRKYNLDKYKEGHLYTDSKFDYYLYRLIKIVSLVTTIIVIGFALAMGYGIIKDTPPTSIIIFLLLVILFILVTKKK